MDCDEPHLTPNEKTQPIHWTERPTGALVAAGSLWPIHMCNELLCQNLILLPATNSKPYVRAPGRPNDKTCKK
jgi:hypothetical protein